MPPKQAANAGPQASGNKGNLAPEEILRAVVVADSFNRRFRPLTLKTPRCLLPLVNVPLIEYTLELLATSGVQEVFVVCCSHSDQIKQYIKSSRWGKSVLPTVSVIVSQQLRSMGDVLRDLDAKQVLESDFVLVSGDVVSNVNLTAAIEEHKARRLKDKNAIMTMLMRQASPNHPTRTRGEEELFVLDAKTNECVHYESSARYPVKRKVKLDPQIFKAHDEVLVRNDLIDCQIDICSIEVPALFTENFDYQDIRRDFLRGILESDLLGKTIFTHVLEEGYAARVSTPQMYDAVSKDIMARWTYPLVPDNSFTGKELYRHTRPYIYKEQVTLDGSTELREKVTIGRNTVVGKDTVIQTAVIGRNCTIGEDVWIEQSYMLDDVTIGDHCEITKCIIGSGVVIKDNVVLSKGCVLGDNVVVGPDVVVPPHTKISLEKEEDDYLSDTDSPTQTPHRDDDEVQSTDCFLGDDAVGFVYVDDEDDDDDIDVRNVAAGYLAEAEESAADTDGDQTGAQSDDEDETDWVSEVHQTIERAFAENHTVDIAALELNTLKMAMNITFADLRDTVLPAILARIDTAKPAASTSAIIARWGPLMAKFTHSSADQLHLIGVVSKFCMSAPATRGKAFVFIVRFLYDIEVLEEDVVLRWYAGLPAASDDGLGRLRKWVEPFVTWLQEAEEDSDDDDEDEDDDEDDEEDSDEE
ncbi:nucleotide-diphospho-sugar transferase [Entophlyctis helioformis]|nr:nucleotide-diphospho-sugar transferase [Entophlyctis helioformis]